MNSYLNILLTNTEILKTTFFTFRPKYDNYSQDVGLKKIISFSNLVYYESSNNISLEMRIR